MRAASRVYCNFRLAIRALLRRCRGGRLLFFMGQGGQLVHSLEQAEQYKRHNQEIHHSGEETGCEACNVLQGVRRAARDQVQNRVDKIIRQGGDDPGKRTADDYADRHVHHVSAKCKGLKLLHKFFHSS